MARQTVETFRRCRLSATVRSDGVPARRRRPSRSQLARPLLGADRAVPDI